MSNSIDKCLVQTALACGLFDEAWYCATYKDVRAIPMDALEHYLRFGSKMGRSPGPSFDSRKYIEEHVDVRASGMDPLVHYIRYGRAEGRCIRAVAPPSTSAPRVSASIPISAPAPLGPKLPLTALVITWDVGHNPLGRSYMLAEVLDRVVRNVVIAGFQFPRYGDHIWEPVREGRMPVISLPGGDMPAFIEQLDKLSDRMQPDIVFACKPRLPSLQLAALIKHKFGCPMVLDIDDHELSFFAGSKEIGLPDLERMDEGSALAHPEPFGALWTGLAQGLRTYADEIIVSNVALHREFGGTIIPHVRDESRFDPALQDRQRSRIKYGVPTDAKVVLFFGTPRQHKGINVLAEAVGRIADGDFRLVVVGTSTDKSVTSQLESLSKGRLTSIPNQPFSAIPEILAMADVVCLPQDENNPISQFQLPAKAIDAVAMGIPLLVAPTPPLMQLVRDGVATAMDVNRLSEMLQEAVSDTSKTCADTPECIRARYLHGYSYASAAKALRVLVLRAMRTVDAQLTQGVPALIAEQRRLFAYRASESIEPAGVDIVVFWKQNDSTMYGRRCDMVIQYLASRTDVRRIVVFDAPISQHDLLLRRNRPDAPTHDRLIYTRTYEKLFGKLDTPKIRYDVFTFPPGKFSFDDACTSRPSFSQAYQHYIASALAREGVEPSKSIFWFYPRNYFAENLVRHFSPRKVVVDVVDDHRAWPGVTDAERKRLTRNYRGVLGCADMAFANCASVMESMSEFADDIRLVPNGCDQPSSARPLLTPDSVAFREFAEFPGKTIGFIGNLEKKIDIALIEKVADAFPECQVVLIGSTHANPDVLRLRDHPNVRMTGVVPYAEIGAWVSRFDVGMIPHVDMELTRSMNPLKLYVYLSWGVPVVSTDVDNLDRSTRFLKVAASHGEFLESVGEMLQQGRAHYEDLECYVQANSWESRFASHVDELLSGAAGTRTATGQGA